METLLQVYDLSIIFNNDKENGHAVRNISFNIKKGELLAIVGESGSGKSATALSLLSLLPVNSKVTGKALFNDGTATDLLKNKDSNKVRGNRIAMIFQEPMTSLNPVLTCGFQVMEVIRKHKQLSTKEAYKKVVALFNEVELPQPEKIIGRYPHQLSGGQKQRVMIAMAMSCEPSLIIADEPTTALDVRVQANILKLLRKLQAKNNMSVLLITHDLGLTADAADSIAVMRKGEIVEQGPASLILNDPQNNYTRALLACRPASNKKNYRLPTIADIDDGINILNESEPHIISEENLLEVKDLVVSFPKKKNIFGKPIGFFNAVDDVSFAIAKGEILGLVGESGCGKTTLGKTIVQLIKPTSGHIYLNGEEITNKSGAALRKLRKNIQIVFQDPYGSLNPRITAGMAIEEVMATHHLYGNRNEKKEKVLSLLRSVNLDEGTYDRYPHQFSGGQRQRICIARSLATEPGFIVFDESVSALDVSVQAQILNLISDLRIQFGFTALFISHDLAVVHHISDRIIVMNKGKIVEEGHASAIYYNPVQEYTRQLVNAIPGKNLTA